MQLVAIKWQDAQKFDGWVDKESASKSKPKACVVGGWLVSQTPECTVVAFLRSEGGEVVGDQIAIATGDVLEMKQFGEVSFGEQNRKNRKK